MECYNIYIPKLTEVPAEVQRNIEACGDALDIGITQADGELSSAKTKADTDSTNVQPDIIGCNNKQDSKENLECHSKQVRLL